LDLPEVDHEEQDGKGRERMDCWIYLKWIMRGRMGKVEKEWTAGFIFNMFLHHTKYEASCLQKKLDVYINNFNLCQTKV